MASSSVAKKYAAYGKNCEFVIDQKQAGVRNLLGFLGPCLDEYEVPSHSKEFAFDRISLSYV